MLNASSWLLDEAKSFNNRDLASQRQSIMDLGKRRCGTVWVPKTVWVQARLCHWGKSTLLRSEPAIFRPGCFRCQYCVFCITAVTGGSHPSGLSADCNLNCLHYSGVASAYNIINSLIEHTLHQWFGVFLIHT
jgi:hypothetical protein